MPPLNYGILPPLLIDELTVSNAETAVPTAVATSSVGIPISKADLRADPSIRVRSLFGIPPPVRISPAIYTSYAQNQTDIKLTRPLYVDPKGLIGIEVEVENVQYIDSNIRLLLWSVDEDGSLRNSGWEFKSRPIPACWAELALKRLFSGLNKDVDFSIRTSIHIHQDVRGATLEQLGNLLLIYLVCEPLLFKFAGTTRKTSHFCVPLLDTGLLDRLEQLSSFNKVLRHIDQYWHKYTALNLLPIRQLGTIEYRHLPGTDNVSQIVNWINLLGAIKLFAYRHSPKELITKINVLNTTSSYKTFLTDIFGDLTVLLDLSDLHRDLDNPVFRVKTCTIHNTFHNARCKTLYPDSPLYQSLGLVSASATLSGVQLKQFQDWCKTFYPEQNPEWFFLEVYANWKYYAKITGAVGTTMLTSVFASPKTS